MRISGFFKGIDRILTYAFFETVKEEP